MTLRSPRLSACGRRLAVWLIALTIGVGACGAASAAGERANRGGRPMMMHGPSSFAGGRAARQERQPHAARAPREMAAPPPVERPVEPPPVERGGGPGRLSPEERRALRQQINDAGRDIYRAPVPRR